MKKMFALVVALCLVFTVAVAEEENSITWEQVLPMVEAGDVTGDFYTFDEISLKIWIPAGMVPGELPYENYIGYFVSEDGSEDAVAVIYVDANGMDLSTYAGQLAEYGATGIEMGTVNGLPCVTYELAEAATMCIAFATQAGYILEVACGPVTSDAEKMGAGVIMASIQAMD